MPISPEPWRIDPAAPDAVRIRAPAFADGQAPVIGAFFGPNARPDATLSVSAPEMLRALRDTGSHLGNLEMGMAVLRDAVGPDLQARLAVPMLTRIRTCRAELRTMAARAEGRS